MQITSTILRTLAVLLLAASSGVASAGGITVRNDGASIMQRTSGQLNSQLADIGKSESAPGIEQPTSDRDPASPSSGILYRVLRKF